MKVTHTKIENVSLYLVGLTFSLGVYAQTYSIDWYTVDGGGGTCTGGVYSLSGTIGQPDAGKTMTGGVFAVTGGFWAMHAVPVEGAPWLWIEAAGPGQATIWWEPDAQGWVLQETTVLHPEDWTNAPSGPTNPVTVPASISPKYFRLSKP